MRVPCGLVINAACWAFKFCMRLVSCGGRFGRACGQGEISSELRAPLMDGIVLLAPVYLSDGNKTDGRVLASVRVERSLRERRVRMKCVGSVVPDAQR